MKKVLLTLLSLSVSGVLTAQTAHQEVITFEEALSLMRNRNERIVAADHEEEAAEMKKKAAYGLRLPTIGASGTYVYMGDDIDLNFNHLKTPVGHVAGDISSAFPGINNIIGGSFQSLMQRNWEVELLDRSLGKASVSLQMPIYMGGKINAANRVAKIDWEESKEKGTQVRHELVSELTERYFGLSLARQVIEVRREVLEGMQVHLNDAVALEENGMIPRVERLHAEMSVAEAKREHQKSVRDAQTINTALENTLNLEGKYTPATSLFIVENLEPVDYFKGMAHDKNPQLKQVELMEQKAKEGVKAQRADFMPQVALMGNASLYKYHMSDILPNWLVGASVKIKIFDGLNREYKYSSAKSQVKQVQALNSKANADIATLVEKIYNEMMAAGEQIESLDVALAFAEEYLRAKEKAFHEGAAPSVDVVDASLNLARIRTERLQAAYSYDLLLAKLLEVCGDSDSYNYYITNRTISPIRYKNN